MKTTLTALGLHLDQQSVLNLGAKVLGLAGLIAGGLFDPADVLMKGFGIALSMAADARIKWWAVALGAVVTYFTSQNTVVQK